MAVSQPMTVVQNMKVAIAPPGMVGGGGQIAMVAGDGDSLVVIWRYFLAIIFSSFAYEFAKYP